MFWTNIMVLHKERYIDHMYEVALTWIIAPAGVSLPISEDVTYCLSFVLTRASSRMSCHVLGAYGSSAAIESRPVSLALILALPSSVHDR